MFYEDYAFVLLPVLFIAFPVLVFIQPSFGVPQPGSFLIFKFKSAKLLMFLPYS